MLQFISAGVGLAQGILGARSAKKAARRKARQIREMGKYRRDVAEMQAKSAVEASKIKTREINRQNRKTQASQKLAMVKSGAQTTSGSPMDVLLDEAKQMSLYANQEKRNDLMAVQELEQKGKMAMYEAEMGAQTARAEGKAAARSSLLSGIGSAISGIGSGLSGMKAAQKANTYQTGSWWKY